MHQPSRLFDVITHQQSRYPQTDMLAAKENDVWRTYSTSEVADITKKFSAGLLQLGIQRGDNIALISINRPEWILTDLACQQIGAVLVPIYPTISAAELQFILEDSGAKMLFVQGDDLYEKAKPFSGHLTIFSFDQLDGVRHWSEIRADNDKAVQAIMDSIQPDDLATIIYTSGTTGIPKGVMLSHANIMSNVTACLEYLPVNEHARALSFLPLNHVFERMVTYVYMLSGVSVYYAEGMETIADNLREVKPGIFTTVPRLLEKVYEKIMARGNKLTGIQRRLFFWAVGIGLRYEINKNQGLWYNMQLAIARKLVFSKWQEALGGNLKCIVTGAAACQLRLLKIFTAAGIVVMEGYGLTETSPVISVNHFEEEGRMFGTVGPVISNVEVKIAEDGEILCKGPNVMLGYYKRPDLTADAVTDGWFHTGDIGVLLQGKFLKITDRKKELFKTSGGKFVAPQPIENKFRESPYIEQIMVVGADRKFAGALIVPDFAYLRKWAADNKVSFELDNPQIRALYKKTVEQYNQSLNHIEQIKKFELMQHEWTVEGGEMTPTLKLKRKVIMEKYRDAVERIYA